MMKIKPPSTDPRADSLATWAMALALMLQTLPAMAQEGPQPKLPTVEIGAGMHRIQAEVAQSMVHQMIGMMGRTQMGNHEGMLFVNAAAEVRCFWMKNTLIPLAIAFIADDGTIVNIAEMEARSEKQHCSTKPVRFALEMNQGWFDKRGIKPGFKLRGTPFEGR